MTRSRFALALLGSFAAAGLAVAAAGDPVPPGHVVVNAGDVVWQNGPAVLPPGAQMAVLRGDPAQEGIFTLRLRAPDGYQIPPHWHPAWENVTVLKGTFWIGAGERADRASAHAVRAGGFTAMPPKLRHYAWTEGETEIQLTAMGPWQLYYVNPADEPARAPAR